MLCVALCGRAARAQPSEPSAPAVEVRWTGPAECDRAEPVRQRIASDLGARPTITTRLDVAVDGEPGRWRAVMRLEGATAIQRTVTAPQCDALADAIALVTVIAIDPFVHASTVAAIVRKGAVVPTPPRLPEPASTIAAPPVQPRTAPRRSRPREPIHGALRAELGTSAFALPGLGFVVGIAPLVEGDRWRVEVPVRWSLPRERDVDTGVSARLQLVAASPRACWVPGRGALGVPLCAGLEAGAMIARGRGDALLRTKTAAERWLAATASVAVRWRVHRRFATWLAIEGVVPFGRPRFHVFRDGDVHQAGPAMLLVAIGGEVHFGPGRR